MVKAFVILVLSVIIGGCQTPIPDSQYTQDLLGKWRISSINQHKAPNYSTAYLQFAADGVLTGNNSCNEFQGSYQLHGQQLQIAANQGTMKACVDALLAQQQQLDNTLPQVQQVSMTGNKLLLLDGDHNVLVKLVKEPTDTLQQ